MMRKDAGVTLIEVLVAVTLLSLLTVGMMYAMSIGFQAFQKTDRTLMENRRVTGAQRILEQELEGLIPVVAPCGPGIPIGFFQGEAQAMRLVSGFSLQQAWRGRPQILELFVIPGEDGRGVRLVVNEIPYAGPVAAGQLCVGRTPDPQSGIAIPRFAPVVAGPGSFVLADNLAYCRFGYLSPVRDPKEPPAWMPGWKLPSAWPLAVRIDMAPLEPNTARLQPISVIAPVYIRRSPEITYVDQ
jgi:prepilin-type N-terminal cleavage/methylation domain-containing protein